MSRPERQGKLIAVGIDGSEESWRALDWAVRESARRHAPLVVVAVAAHREDRSPVEQAAQLAVARCGELAPEVAVTSDVRSGHPAEELVRASEQAELLVLGSRGAGGFRGLLVGSVSTTVAGHAHCSVVVVRGRELDTIALEHAAVVVGVGAQPHEPALEFAFEAASARGVGLVAVHTWRPSEAEHAETVISPLLDWDRMQDQAQRALAESLAASRERYPDVKVDQVVHREHPVSALVAAGAAAQLIVVGRRRRTKFPALHLGSVTNGVLHHAPCPVIVARGETA